MVDYAYYKEVYRGRLGLEDFERLQPKTSAYLDRVTLGRITPSLSSAAAVKNARCAVTDALALNETRSGLTSESNDGLSVTYAADPKADGKRLYEAAALHLWRTGLLYQGVE